MIRTSIKKNSKIIITKFLHNFSAAVVISQIATSCMSVASPKQRTGEKLFYFDGDRKVLVYPVVDRIAENGASEENLFLKIDPKANLEMVNGITKIYQVKSEKALQDLKKGIVPEKKSTHYFSPVYTTNPNSETYFYPAGKTILQFKEEISAETIESFLKKENLKKSQNQVSIPKMVIVDSPMGDEAFSFANALKAKPEILFATPDLWQRAQAKTRFTR